MRTTGPRGPPGARRLHALHDDPTHRAPVRAAATPTPTRQTPSQQQRKMPLTKGKTASMKMTVSAK
eukprot:12598369-Alexandrium_andersonii.AAC.1